MNHASDQRLTAILLFLVSLAVYSLTMAVTVCFWDAGEFIAVSYILGIPHSPGTPLYVLVGRIFAMLPLPLSIAQRVNFLSVLTGALGVTLAFLIGAEVVRFMYGEGRTRLGRFARLAGPAVGALFLTFSDTYWTDAIEAEVYALSGFVMGLCTYLALRWLRDPSGAVSGPERSRGLLLLVVYLLSLGIGFHLGTILVYGGILLMILMVREKSLSDFEILVFTFGMAVLVADMTLHRSSGVTLAGLGIFAALAVWCSLSGGRFALGAFLLFALGVSVHLFMYIRSFHDPAIDMVDPQTWGALYAHLRREQYPPINVFERKAPFLFQVQHFAGYFREQFRLFGDVRLGALNLGAASVLVPTMLGFWGLASNWVRERRTFVLNATSLALNSLGLIVFLNFSATEVRERDYFYGGAFYYFAVFIGIGSTSLLLWAREEARRRAVSAARWVVPLGALLLLCSLLPARYHWFSHDRSRDWIPRDYAHNILASVEPDAILFTNGDNDTYPLWYIQLVEGFRTDVRVANLSLLNTDWYIRQIRDREPRAPITLSDAEIARMQPMILSGGGVAWKRDLAVQHIIRETNWKRPIYFAVTVPSEIWNPYADYLETQGMVRRLVPARREFQINEFMMRRNFEDVFLFRGVLNEDWEIDDSVYKSSDTKGMFFNFAVAAFQVAQQSGARQEYEEAVRWGELSLRLHRDFDFPRRFLGLYYARAGRFEEAVAHYEREIERQPRRGEFWVALANVHEEREDLAAAVEVLEQAVRRAPDHRDVFAQGFRISAMLGREQQAKSFVRRRLEAQPDDRDFRELAEHIDQILYDEFGIGRLPDTRDAEEER